MNRILIKFKKNQFRLNNFLIGLGIFLITLQAYYFYQISLSPFPIFGSLLLILFGIRNSFSKKILFKTREIANAHDDLIVSVDVSDDGSLIVTGR